VAGLGLGLELGQACGYAQVSGWSELEEHVL
jgi:hypothetical protein